MYRCGKCGSQFQTREALREHIYNSHMADRAEADALLAEHDDAGKENADDSG